MPEIATGLTAVGSLIAADMASDSADNAVDAQKSASDAAINENRRQFEETKKLLNPYTQSGVEALDAYKAFSGIGGQAALLGQQNNILNSDTYRGLLREGEQSILRNASATGGLRGGGTQNALASFAPSLLRAMMDDRYQKLGGLVQLGQNSAANTASQGFNSSSQIQNLLRDIGNFEASGALAQGRVQGGLLGDLTKLYGANSTKTNDFFANLFGGSSKPIPPTFDYARGGIVDDTVFDEISSSQPSWIAGLGRG